MKGIQQVVKWIPKLGKQNVTERIQQVVKLPSFGIHLTTCWILSLTFCLPSFGIHLTTCWILSLTFSAYQAFGIHLTTCWILSLTFCLPIFGIHLITCWILSLTFCLPNFWYSFKQLVESFHLHSAYQTLVFI